jgi:5-methylcytosine-specific restriction endonuclease McrA
MDELRMTPVVRLCSKCGKIATHGCHCNYHHVAEQLRRRVKTKAAGYASPHWQMMRGKALDQAGHRCSACGTSERLTVHLDPRLRGNHNLATLDACTVLCRGCHGAVDAPRAHA